MLSGGPKSGEETGGAPPRATFFHEMIHQWVGQIEGPPGVTSWFSEGLTSYYTLALPLRGGYVSLAEYQDGINRLAERYYTSPALNMTMHEIAEVGFGNEDIRSTPYQRGALYFADLDARIRRKSEGTRTLDDLVRGIFRQRHEDPKYVFDQAAWIYALIADLGAQAADDFKSHVLGGETLHAAPEAFGPCFEREPATYTSGDTPVSGYRWVRKAGIADEQCRTW
jgi:predicted metalloprotease with PDZ domain